VLVPHHAGAEEVPVPAEVPAIWTGPMLLRDPQELLSREAARSALGLPPDGTIGLWSLGGGGEPEAVAARDIVARAALVAGGGVLWVEAEGPLSREATPQTGTVLRDVYPLLPYLPAFDLAVAAAGYNTVQELQAAAVPAVLWPFSRDVDDQQARASSLADAGRALMVDEGAGGSDEDHLARVSQLSAAISALLQPETRERLRRAMGAPPPGAAVPAENGAHVGARAILELLGITAAQAASGAAPVG